MAWRGNHVGLSAGKDQKIDKPYCKTLNKSKNTVKDELNSAKSQVLEKPGDLNGFRKGLRAETILGATHARGELLFLMKWAGRNEADLVRSAEARIICPLIVLEFYEKNLKWLHTCK